MDDKNNLPINDIQNIDIEKINSKNEENEISQNEKKNEIPENKINQETNTDLNDIKKNEEEINKEELKNEEHENNFNNNENNDKKEENPPILNSDQEKTENENNILKKEINEPIDENKNENIQKEKEENNINEDDIPNKDMVEKNKEDEKDKLKEEIIKEENQENKKINQENNIGENINSFQNININEELKTNDNNIIPEINPAGQDINENININYELRNGNQMMDEANDEENQVVEGLVKDLEPADIFNQNNRRESEETNELAKKLSEQEVENINEIDQRPKCDMRAFLEEGAKKKKLEEYSKNIDNLLDSITMEWLSGDRNSYITKYEYQYISEMNELFNKINENESIKDELICKVFKFICDYFFRRKDILNEIPWIEMNNLRKILTKENFEGVCILKDNNLLIEQYQELILCYNIEKTENNIIEYNNCNFFKYLIEFLFRIDFFESYLDKVYLRDDEIFYSQVDNEMNFFLDEFIKLICYPMEVFSFCKKEYLVKNNYFEKFITKFLMKIENIIKSTSLKEEFKKQFYNIMTEKYKIIIGTMFNSFFDENKDNKNASWEKLTYYVLIIAENYLKQQKLESRIYGLNLLSQMIEAFKDENNEPEYANKLLFVKKSIINQINKINIFSLIFEENIHEALVPRTYNLLSFLYKNKSFSKEQIKHLWMLSQDKYQTISDSIIELFGKLLPEFSIDDSNEI